MAPESSTFEEQVRYAAFSSLRTDREEFAKRRSETGEASEGLDTAQRRRVARGGPDTRRGGGAEVLVKCRSSAVVVSFIACRVRDRAFRPTKTEKTPDHIVRWVTIVRPETASRSMQNSSSTETSGPMLACHASRRPASKCVILIVVFMAFEDRPVKNEKSCTVPGAGFPESRIRGCQCV